MGSGMRVTVLALVLLLPALSGCIENMDHLKEILGFAEPPPPEPEPDPAAPPVAKAQANATRAVAGVPIRFLSEGSRDPQGLPLRFHWQFGDGETAEGPVVTHAFAQAGEYLVQLTVVNDAGLSDDDVVLVDVAPGNRPPVAAFEIWRGLDFAARSAETGDALRFVSNGTRDPDGDALTFEWDFGDGRTSHAPNPDHSYREPGLYTIVLRVLDGQLSATASRLVAINTTATHQGRFDVGGDETKAYPLVVAQGADRLRVALTFDANLGANDLLVRLLDPDGQEVARTPGETEAGAQGPQTREVTLAGDFLAQQKPGTWTLQVVKTKGVQVTFTLTARETF